MQMILVLLKNSTDPLEFLNKLLRNYHVIGNIFLFLNLLSVQRCMVLLCLKQ